MLTEEELMNDRKIASSWVISFVSVWVGSCIFCAVLVPHIYGLHGTDTLNSYSSLSEQREAFWGASAIATFFSSFFVGLVVQRRFKKKDTVILAWVVAFFGLTIYGLLGCEGILGGGFAVGHLHVSTNLLFPSFMFAEFNFFTFILELAPLTAFVAAILTYLSLQFTRQGNARIV
jgi:hypothetical protein